MSEKRLKRRQFLADALFAGGALGAAALATRWFVEPAPEPSEPPPVAKVDPKPEPKPEGPKLVRPRKPRPEETERKDLNIQGGYRMQPSDCLPAPAQPQ